MSKVTIKAVQQGSKLREKAINNPKRWPSIDGGGGCPQPVSIFVSLIDRLPQDAGLRLHRDSAPKPKSWSWESWIQLDSVGFSWIRLVSYPLPSAAEKCEASWYQVDG